MSVETAQERLAWLASAAENGTVHTVRVSWSDRLGGWRGKRVPVDVFLGSPERRLSFCDGMIVVDVNCDVHQSTPFSNFQTGYPDMYLRPRLETLALVGWYPGEAYLFGVLESHGGTPLPVAPRNVLGAVLDRLADQGIEMQVTLTLGGRLMHSATSPARLLADGRVQGEPAPGVLRLAAEGLIRSGVPVRAIETSRDGMYELTLGAGDPRSAADAATLAKAALKETAAASAQLTAVFMTRPPGALRPCAMRIELEMGGVADADPARFAAALSVLRPLLAPSINAFRAGRPAPPRWENRDGGSALAGVDASSEADPATVLAATAAAIGAAVNLEVDVSEAEPGDLAAAARTLGAAGWVRDWLGDDLVENVVPLLLDEVTAFEASVTDWEVERYWRAG